MASDIDPADYLRKLGESGDGPHEIATAALMLAALDHSARPLQPYRAHLQELSEVARAELRFAHGGEDAARALARLLAGRYGYEGDRMAYDDPQNADLIAVIDRRRGLPVALGILYLHAARAGGLEAVGLNSPGHFLLRVFAKTGSALIDPFNGGAAMDPERLGAPPAMGGAPPEAERLIEPVSDTEVLLRLENNLKLRALQTGARARALEVAKRMVLIGPRRAELWLDLARLNEATGALGAAQKAYEACLSLAAAGTSIHNEAALGLHGLKRRLN